MRKEKVGSGSVMVEEIRWIGRGGRRMMLIFGLGRGEFRG